MVLGGRALLIWSMIMVQLPVDKGKEFKLVYVLQRRVCVVADCFQLQCTGAGKDFKYWLTWSMLC